MNSVFTDFDQIIRYEKKYKIIYADPPWEYRDKALAGKRGAACKYETLDDCDLEKLPVERISDDDSIMFMWATFPKLVDALKLIKVWGFEYKTIAFNWVKLTKQNTFHMGMGNWTRSNSEICLLATRGKPKRINADVHSVIMTQYTEHSKKPDEIRKRIIRLVGDLPRIELFARNRVHGWDVFGNDHKLKLQPLESY